jgi:predicted transcriptional regulator
VVGGVWITPVIGCRSGRHAKIMMSEDSSNSRGRKKRAAQLVQSFQQDFVQYQYEFIECLLPHLADLSRSFGGDLHLPILPGAIGQVRLKEIRAAPRDGRGIDAIDPEASTITASRLADVSGIPRETVRRKLAVLKTAGWIDQTQGGAWFLVVEPDDPYSRARRDLADVDHRSMMRVANFIAGREALRVMGADDND